MKKHWLGTLIVIFSTAGLLAGPTAFAITQDKINAEIQIVCPDAYGNWFSGSGTIIDSKGIILTNKHVVTDEKGGIIKTCFIGFVGSISQPPDFGTSPNFNLAEVKYYTTTSDMDAAILYLNNPTNKIYPSVDIWNSDSSALKFGDKLEVIGFPSIGGSTITYTSGDFSGFGSSTDGTQNYIKSTAQLEHGNSGGAAYNSTGKFIGIPSMVVSGTLNSLSYILSINSLKKWLSSILGGNYADQIESIKVTPQLENKISIQNDVTPPTMNDFDIQYSIINDHNKKQSFISYSIPLNKVSEEGRVVQLYYYFGSNILADPIRDGKEIVVTNQQKISIVDNFLLSANELFFIIKLQDDSGNISSKIVSPWDIPAMLKIGAEEFIYNEAITNFTTVNQDVFNKYSGLFVKNNNAIWWVSPKDKVRFLVYDTSLETNFALKHLNDWYNSWWNGYYASTGITTSDLAKRPRHVWGHLLSERKDDGTGSAESKYTLHYIHPRTGILYDLDPYISWPYVDITTSDGLELLNFINTIAVNISDTDLNRIEPLGIKNYIWQTLKYNRDNNLLPLYGFATPSIKDAQAGAVQSSLNKLNGQILLQVESHGEAWYVNPADSKRYYMKDGSAAYNMMRSFGLGITDADLAKIPAVADQQAMKDSAGVCSSNSTASRLKGKILLQVNQHGEAWYVHPDKCRRIYMKDGGVAYQIMRFLSLGITNVDLAKLPEGSL